MKTTRLEKLLLFALCLGFFQIAVANEEQLDDDLFLWFADLSSEEAELFIQQDPEQLEQDLESAKILFAQSELQIEQSKTNNLIPETTISEDSDHE